MQWCAAEPVNDAGFWRILFGRRRDAMLAAVARSTRKAGVTL